MSYMPIHLTEAQLKRLKKIILRSGDPTNMMYEVVETIDFRLEENAKEKAQAAPWRKVVRFDKTPMGLFGHRGWETLECGHQRELRCSERHVEERAKKRRCRVCNGTYLEDETRGWREEARGE